MRNALVSHFVSSCRNRVKPTFPWIGSALPRSMMRLQLPRRGIPLVVERSMDGLSLPRSRPVRMGAKWLRLLCTTIPIMRTSYCRRALLKIGIRRSATRKNWRILLAGAAYPNR